MSKTVVLSAAQSLIDEVVSFLPAETRDFTRYAIVFPGKRPAHFVRKALARRANGAIIPPRIFSIDSFVEFLLSEKLGLRKRSLEPIDAASILYDIHLEANDRLGGDHFRSLDAFLPIGLKLFSELEELALANLSTKKIRDELATIPYGRLHALSLYYDRFYQEVERRSCVTRSISYRAVADRIEEIEFNDFEILQLAGFYGLTNAENQIFAGLRRKENVVFIFQQGRGLQTHLRALGMQSDSPAHATESNSTRYYFYKAPDTHGQVLALNEKIKERVDRSETVDEKTVIVLPTSEALFPVLHQTLTLLDGHGCNIALGYPLSRTPIYGFLSSLMDLVLSRHREKFTATYYLMFILHPYTKNILFGNRSDVTRVLFHAIEEHLAATKATLLKLEELEQQNELFRSVAETLSGSDGTVSSDQLREHLKAIHDHTIRKFLGFETINDLVANATEVVLFIYEHSTARFHPLFRPYVEKLLEVLDVVSTSLLSDRKFDEPAGYFAFLRSCIAAQDVPFPGTPLKGLQVLGLLETRNLKFENVYVLDVNEDVIPASAAQEMLLPQSLRERLGLETYRDREKLIEYYFELLLKGAKEVHLFFAENDKKEKSRFVEKLLWKRQQEEKQFGSKEYVQSIRYEVLLANSTPEPIKKTESVVEYLKGFKYNATVLDTYLKCPLKFYYRYVLGLTEKEEVSGEIERADIGRFVHSVLSEFFEGQKGKILKSADLSLEHLDRIVELKFHEYFGEEPFGSRYLLKNQIQKQLRRFVEHYQIPLLKKGELTILDLESVQQATIEGFNLTARFDRIERRSEKIFIVDYKTGSSDASLRIRFDKLDSEDRSTWRKAIGSLQLPMYALLYSNAHRVSIEQIVPLYLMLGKQKIDSEIEIRLFDEDDDKSKNFTILEQVISGVLEEIINPEEPFRPTSEVEKDCPNCPFNVVCGTQWAKAVGSIQ